MVPQKLKNWLGLPVTTWAPKDGLPDYANKIYRLEYDWDNEIPLEESLPAFLAGSGVEESQGLILGQPYDTAEDFGAQVAVLVENKEKLPKLRGLFLGEMDQEDSEISWIENGDMAPVIAAFPGLDDLRIRGTNSMTWERSRHICLKKLIIESGGFDAALLPNILNSVMPELEHLEIWLGTDGYGWEGSADDVKPFLYNNPFPKLKYLGLKNCDHQTEIAIMAAQAPIVEQLETLDLSGGALKDEGGQALLDSESIKGLKKLDLHFHYMSEEMVNKFTSSGLNVDVSDPQEVDTYDDEVYYYVSVGE